MAELHQRGVEIAGVVVRRLVNPRRFIGEFERDRMRLLRKIWKKAILRERAFDENDDRTIAAYKRELGLSHDNIDDLGADYGIPVQYCNTLNDTEVVEFLERVEPRVVAFTGGGLIREPVLERAGDGVLNCHMGVLPEYRGMDVVEWPILREDFDQVGLTVHFMDQGIDTGDILRVERFEPRPNDSIQRLRKRMKPGMCRLLTQTCIDYLRGDVSRKPQRENDGRQYFRMHPRLEEIAKEKYREYTGRLEGRRN